MKPSSVRFRQLGHKSLSSLTSSSERGAAASEDNGNSSSGVGGGGSKLVPLVQGLSHQVHLFLGKTFCYTNLY